MYGLEKTVIREGQNLENRFSFIGQSSWWFNFSSADFLPCGISYLAEPNSAENVPADGEMVSRVTAEHNDSLTRLKRAAATAVSAAAAKAKLLAEQEEDQIRRLAALVVEKLV